LAGDDRTFDHLPHLGVAFGGGDVPGERHQIAPVAGITEQRSGALDVTAPKRGIECDQPFGDVLCRRLLAHHLSPGFGWTAMEPVRRRALSEQVNQAAFAFDRQ